MDYRSTFEVEPGAKVRLAKIDPAYTGKHESHEKAEPEIRQHVERMDRLQYLTTSRFLWCYVAMDGSGRCGKETIGSC
jgi:hypothetical protein